jgi:hypothetical protein
MAEIVPIKLLLRRGTDDERKDVVFDNGEIGYVTDKSSRRIIVGDGFTPGGFSVGMKFQSGHVAAGNQSFVRALSGDLVYNEGTQSLYILTGAEFTLQNSYYNISPRYDNRTITLNRTGEFTINNYGLSSIQLNSTIFDSQFGIIRAEAASKFRVNIDNVSIKFDESNRIYADPNFIDWDTLPTSNPGPNKLWINTAEGNAVKVGT